MIEEINLADIDFTTAETVKQRKARSVFRIGNLYYKVWVPNWSQGDITKHAIDSGFYNEVLAGALTSLLVDESGQRGYVCKAGKSLQAGPWHPHHSLSKFWNAFCKNVDLSARARFMYELLDRAIRSGGMYTDLAPQNMILIDNKISLIDLESYSSFSFLFDKERQPYEKFSLDAKWKPHKSFTGAVDKYYKQYFKACLNIDIAKQKINSIGMVKELRDMLKERQTSGYWNRQQDREV